MYQVLDDLLKLKVKLFIRLIPLFLYVVLEVKSYQLLIFLNKIWVAASLPHPGQAVNSRSPLLRRDLFIFPYLLFLLINEVWLKSSYKGQLEEQRRNILKEGEECLADVL